MVHSPPLQKRASRVRTVRPFEEPCKPQLLSDHGRAASDAIRAEDRKLRSSAGAPSAALKTSRHKRVTSTKADRFQIFVGLDDLAQPIFRGAVAAIGVRSEEHTSELSH